MYNILFNRGGGNSREATASPKVYLDFTLGKIVYESKVQNTYNILFEI